MSKSYSELITIPTFEDRVQYLLTHSGVAEPTFASQRWANQAFYHSAVWQRIRRDIIVRDNACDLAFPGHEVAGQFLIHHINPITIDDLVNSAPSVTDPDNLVVVSLATHNLIHYGTVQKEHFQEVERAPGDTKLW